MGPRGAPRSEVNLNHFSTLFTNYWLEKHLKVNIQSCDFKMKGSSQVTGSSSCPDDALNSETTQLTLTLGGTMDSILRPNKTFFFF